MTYYIWAGIALALGGAFYLALRSPAVWMAIAQALSSAAEAALLKGLKPKDFTQAQKDQIARGEEVHTAGQSARPYDRQKNE